MAVGLNEALIPDGVVAAIAVVVDRDESAAAVGITEAVAVSADGLPIAVAASGGSINRIIRRAPGRPFRRRVPR